MNKLIKRFFIVFVMMIMLFEGTAMAALPDYSGGVSDEYEYNEMVFVSGTPLLFKGTYTLTEKAGDPISTTDYKFKLTCNTTDSTGKAVIAKLDRTMTYQTTKEVFPDKGQTILKTTVKKFKETITIGKAKYELADYQFSRSDVVDDRPASSFVSGNFEGKKVFTINKTEGNVDIDFSGGIVGYSNFWGDTETVNGTYYYSYDRAVPAAANSTASAVQLDWNGTVTTKGSDSMTKALQYYGNDAKYSSFEGGYVKSTKSGMVSELSYDMPLFRSDGSLSSSRNTDNKNLNADNMPKVERLIVPKFRDIGSISAENDIKKLYSLDVFDDSQSFFSPNTAMTKMQFIRALMRACDIRVADTTKKKPTVSSRKKTVEKSMFSDIAIDDPNYTYAKDAVTKGIVTLGADSRFNPNDSVTMLQATAMLVRAIGFENRAPSPGFSTQFTDDAQIPEWAKDSAYMAYDTGIVKGDEAGRFNPNKKLSRAEASSMLVRFLDFLETDLQKDYREHIINYS